MAGLLDIVKDGDYSLVINGQSKHLDTDREFNEINSGGGLLAERDGKFVTVGGYKNSFGKPSYYAGGGIKKRFGRDFYIEPGLIGGVVTGYEDVVTPMVMPMVTLGQRGRGSLNMMYAPELEKNPAVLMMNLSVPFK